MDIHWMKQKHDGSYAIACGATVKMNSGQWAMSPRLVTCTDCGMIISKYYYKSQESTLEGCSPDGQITGGSTSNDAEEDPLR